MYVFALFVQMCGIVQGVSSGICSSVTGVIMSSLVVYALIYSPVFVWEDITTIIEQTTRHSTHIFVYYFECMRCMGS